jgi:hypothetical protein
MRNVEIHVGKTFLSCRNTRKSEEYTLIEQYTINTSIDHRNHPVVIYSASGIRVFLLFYVDHKYTYISINKIAMRRYVRTYVMAFCILAL